MSAQSHMRGEVRTAEVVGALCLATDLGMGFPFEHGLHTTLIAMRLAERLGVDRSTALQSYYASLLAHAGCTTDVHLTGHVFGASLTTNLHPVMFGSRLDVLGGLIRALPPDDTTGAWRAVEVVRRVPRLALEARPHMTASCEVAQMLGERVGAPASVPPLLAYLLERWDGHGPLARAKAEEIQLPMRIFAVAMDAAFQRLTSPTAERSAAAIPDAMKLLMLPMRLRAPRRLAIAYGWARQATDRPRGRELVPARGHDDSRRRARPQPRNQGT